MILKLVFCILFIGAVCFLLREDPHTYKKKIVLKESVKVVQDSMKVLRSICEDYEADNFMNCIVNPVDSILVFNTVSLGKVDSVSASNKEFKNMKKKNAVRLLSIMKFLNNNLISGVYHDVSIGFWLYPYGEGKDYNNIKYNRVLYCWDIPKDTLSSSFIYYFKILDREHNIVLLSSNDVPFKK